VHENKEIQFTKRVLSMFPFEHTVSVDG